MSRLYNKHKTGIKIKYSNRAVTSSTSLSWIIQLVTEALCIIKNITLLYMQHFM